MTTADIARTVVGIIGNIISGALFLSPVPTFIEIWKKRSVEQFSPIPYLAMVVNCMVWTLYGLPMVHPHSILVVTINGSGSGVALIFIALFLIYSDGKKRLKEPWLIVFTIYNGAETGDQDQECGVHALLHLSRIFWKWRGLDHLRSHPFRPIHHYTKWAWDIACGGSAASVCHLLQVHSEADSSKKCHKRGEFVTCYGG
ncbi:bidirectional sugar transporter SWEET6b isoform X3 [Vigna radiata var. radiata]|uniref:Bidirectional sugar transporter SWEET6b isoform X3 n=1 Tax=Vigna radiata var. radiata TaxID=3916 RepID=A0A3Q0F7I1_VIGRR|nr:bidirectional sugar transporter SWEET6b isoform X3 [Vigna radiata var. radiata]